MGDGVQRDGESAGVGGGEGQQRDEGHDQMKGTARKK